MKREISILLPPGNLIIMPPGAPTIILLIIFITKKHKRGDIGIPFTQKILVSNRKNGSSNEF
jgi:hypothetical protein